MSEYNPYISKHGPVVTLEEGRYAFLGCATPSGSIATVRAGDIDTAVRAVTSMLADQKLYLTGRTWCAGSLMVVSGGRGYPWFAQCTFCGMDVNLSTVTSYSTGVGLVEARLALHGGS